MKSLGLILVMVIPALAGVVHHHVFHGHHHHHHHHADFFGYNSYRLLGDSPDDHIGRNGLSISSHGTTITDGPEGLKAWEFHGEPHSFVKVENDLGKLDFGGKSWTVGTFFYQQGRVTHGPILEWRGHGPFGTHFWIWGGGLFANLDASAGRNVMYKMKAPTPNAWHFVGASYNARTGDFYMWDNNEVMHKNTGKLHALDQTGDVFIGIRPSQPSFNPLKAKLAGMTLLDGAINPSEIASFRDQITGNY